MLRTLTAWTWSGPRTIDESHGSPESDTMQRVLGARAWKSLPAAVRRRFARTAPSTYAGITETKLTSIGRAFAWALFLFGAPIPVLSGRRNTVVNVGAKHGGMAWTRHYQGPIGVRLSVRSIKRLSEDGRLFECCAGGWTMLLDVFADHDGITFRSRQFFWRGLGISVPLPLFVTPGTAEVRHTDLGGGVFRFTLAFDHPWFGQTIYQDGIFEDPVELVP